MRYRVRALATDEELLRFQSGFSETIRERSRGRVSSEVPLEYLRRCHTVRGVFDRQGQIVGGYAIGAAPPYRLLDFVPEPARGTLPPPAGATWSDCCEITCVWRASALSRWAMNLFVWPRVALDVLSTKRALVLGGDQNMRVDAKYLRMTRAHTLYVGPSTFGFPSRLFAFRRSSAIRGALWAASVEPVLRLLRKLAPRPRLSDRSAHDEYSLH